MNPSNSVELTTSKQQQQINDCASFGQILSKLEVGGNSDDDQSEEERDQEVTRVSLSHDEEEEDEDEDDEEGEEENVGEIEEGGDNEHNRDELEGENEEEELQVDHLGGQITATDLGTQINLEESSGSFEGNSAQDGSTNHLLSNQRLRALEMTTNEPLRSSTQLQHHRQDQQQHRQHKQINQQANKDYDEVKQVQLFGVSIVALIINGKERLCLAQISNTLLKEFSYNEIHNRRVALGITCIQCTPIQLEMLRRAGAMPSSSRRCGMITMREAERLCRSFLVEEQPPELPENFYFTVAHRVNYGCKGRFVPARYISSRAKCIECFYCGEFYSPNKFIFHSHRQPHATDCNPPDSPNINSWRKHIDLDWTQEHSQEIKYAWEDVKSLFNGGTRRRAPNNQQQASTGNSNMKAANKLAESPVVSSLSLSSHRTSRNNQLADDEQLIVDVECDDSALNKAESVALNNEFKLETTNGNGSNKRSASKGWNFDGRFSSSTNQGRQNNSLMLNNNKSSSLNNQTSSKASGGQTVSSGVKRFSSGQHQASKRFAACNLIQQPVQVEDQTQNKQSINERLSAPTPLNISQFQAQCPNMSPIRSHSMAPPAIPPSVSSTTSQNLPFSRDFLNHANSPTSVSASRQQQVNPISPSIAARKAALGLVYPMSTTSNFIYSQLYNQLIQPQAQSQSQSQSTQPQTAVNQQKQQQQQQHLNSANVEAHLALRHHLWSSLLANLQCSAASNQTYSLQPNVNHCSTSTQPLISPEQELIPTPANLGHIFSTQLYSQVAQQNNQLASKMQTRQPNNMVDSASYKSNQSTPFAMHKFSHTGETGDV